MSDEKPNGSKTSARRAFRVKLSPGPTEEVIVLAADAVRAVELLGEKFDWEKIELSRIDEAQLIADDPKEPSSLPSADTMRLRSCLSYIRQVAFGENPRVVLGSIPDYAEEELQSVIRLRANYDRRLKEARRLTKERDFLYELLENCCRAALGKPIKEIAPDEPWDDQAKFVEMKAALDAVIGLRRRFEAVGG